MRIDCLTSKASLIQRQCISKPRISPLPSAEDNFLTMYRAYVKIPKGYPDLAFATGPAWRPKHTRTSQTLDWPGWYVIVFQAAMGQVHPVDWPSLFVP